MKDIISKKRKELGLTQQQLAEKLNISDKVVSKWETGKSLPDTAMLIPLAEALQISINELMDRNDAVAEIDNTTKYTVSVSYKNSCIIVMAMQLAAAILIIVSRILWDRIGYYEADISESIVYVLMTLGVLCEIVAIAFYLIRRNNLLVKYPTRTDYDKKYVNVMLGCTYPLVLAVIITFVALHGLSTIEQLITLIISAVIAILPFAALFMFNKKRKG